MKMQANIPFIIDGRAEQFPDFLSNRIDRMIDGNPLIDFDSWLIQQQKTELIFPLFSNPSWDELLHMEPGIICDWYTDGIRCLIVRGPVALNAYLGIPAGHPLYGVDHDDMPIDCHCGLTFGTEGDGDYWPEGYYWIGWDYAHCDDRCFYDDLRPIPGFNALKSKSKRWLPIDVYNEVWSACYDLNRLMRLAEQVHNRAVSEAVGVKLMELADL